MPPSCDQWIMLLGPQQVVQGQREVKLFLESVVKVVGLNRNPVVQHNRELLLQSSVEKSVLSRISGFIHPKDV